MYPIVLLSVFGIATLFLGFSKRSGILLPSTLLFLLLTLGSNFIDWDQGEISYFYDMLRINNTGIIFSATLLLSAFMIAAMTGGFENDDSAQPAEYYALMLFSLVGAIMMVTFNHMIMLFLGLEILSLAMYVLAGSDKRNLRSNEAALKYFLMGAFTSGIILFGMALIYAGTGSFSIEGIRSYISVYGSADALLSYPPKHISYLMYPGLLLLLVGMLFKVSAVPFHFWTPDVYEGSPTIFTAFMATIVKTASFAAIYRLLAIAFPSVYATWWPVLATVAILTLFLGNITAVSQTSFKRMMAYSSISHAGYMLIALTALTANSEKALLFYSLAYCMATIGAFGVLLVVSNARPLPEGRPNETFEAFNGLGRSNPILSFILAVSMLSLSGIPLTAGFWGKFMVFGTAIEKGLTWMLVIAVLMSAVGIYVYFRVIINAYMREGTLDKIRVAPFYMFVLIAVAVISVLLGIAPNILEQFL